MITLVLLLFLGRYLAHAEPASVAQDIIQTVSIFSKKYEDKFDMKIRIYDEIPCDNREVLKLEGLNIMDIQDNLIQSDTIRHVSFRNNSLIKVSPEILSRVSRLSCLDLSKNKINLKNTNFIKHSTVRVLDLSDQTPEFPEWRFTEAEDLKDIRKNIESITFNIIDMYLPNLEHLLLNGNDIISLPDTFSKSFPKLTHIYLNNIKAINVNPDFFNVIPKTLRALHLKNNNLSNLTLTNMTGITDLYLDGNPSLMNIEINSKKLRILSLSNGSAMASNIILHTPYLEYLDISRNKYYSLPIIEYDNLQSLKIILLDYNEFSSFPLFPFNLPIIKLSLSYNKLLQISSESFERSTFLKMLSLRGNRIKHIESDAFKDLNHLQFLDLSENQLVKLPNGWAFSLMNLQFFNVSSNYFEKISDLSVSSFNAISHLFILNTTFITDISTKDLAILPNKITVYLH